MVKLCDVQEFPNVKCDKAMALKPLEESSEVFGAWQLAMDFQRTAPKELADKSKQGVSCINNILYEIADCVTACCNLSASLGCKDLTPYLEAVRKSNLKRGRYAQGKKK